MVKKISLKLAVLLSLVALVLVGCGGGGTSENESTSETEATTESSSSEETEETKGDEGESDGEGETIQIGTLASMEPMVIPLTDQLEEKGYDVERVIFDGNHLPAVALSDDEINAVIANHISWLNTFNEENGTNLVMEEPYIAASEFGLYSSEYGTIEEFPEGARITISGDPSNMDRSLTTLEEAGLITLGEKDGNFYTILDIEENPKNIELIEAEITQVAISFEDVDGVVTHASSLIDAGYSGDNQLASHPTPEEYGIGIILNGDSDESSKEWMADALEIIQTVEYNEALIEAYDGTYVPFNYEQ